MTIALAFLLTVVAIALGVQAWALVHLREQRGRIDARLDDLTRRAAARRTSPQPNVVLHTLEGAAVRIADLARAGKPVVAIVTDPRCGPCYELLPDIGGWERLYGDRLTFALISGGTMAQNRAMTAEYGIQTVLLQEDTSFVEAFGLVQAPAALLFGSDGSLSGAPAYGAMGVRGLVAGALGLALPERLGEPAGPSQPVAAGAPAPHFRRPDLDGNVIEPAALRGRDTVLLFWSPGCSHCQELLPEMLAWETDPAAPRLIVVSSGPVTLNRESGLRSPIVLDDDRTIRDRYGVTGTPVGILIDRNGIVRTKPFRGASGVRELMQRYARALAAA